MPTYLLRALDPTLWRRVKARAAADGVSVRRLIIWWLELYADGGLTAVEQRGDQPPASEPLKRTI